jgi:hypothetical protein
MAIRVGMSVAEAIMQLTKGFKKMMGRDPSGLEKIKIQQEAMQRIEDLNKVVDMEGNVIDTSKGIMGGKQIQDSPEFGARIKETYDAAKGPGKGQEMVDALKSPGAQKTKSIMEDQLGMKLYGDETFEEILEIQRTGKHPRGEPSAKRLKEELMKTDNPFSDLVKTTEKGPKSVQQRRKEAEEALKNKNVVPIKDPDKKADGGRIGYQDGSPKVDERMQNTLEQNTKLNQIQRNINERIRKGSKTQGLEIGQLREMYGRKPTEYNLYNPNLAMNEAQKYGAASNMGLEPEQIKAISYFNTLRKNFGDMGMMAPPPLAGGPGLMGPMSGSTNPLAMEKFFKTPAEQFAQYQEGLRRTMMLNPNSGIYFNPKGTYDTGGGIFGAGQSKFKSGIYDFAEPDPDASRGMMIDGKRYSSEQDAIDDMGVERYNQFMANGGRIGYKLGSIDKARRAFLKTVGAVGAGIGAAKTGLMTLGKNIEPVAETVKETVTKAPEYFFALMDKIRRFGKSVDDVTADPRVERTYVYKDYELKENAFGEPGEMIITKKTDQGPFGYKEESMRYKKGGATEDGMVADEYEELTLRPDREGKLKDVEEGIDDASEIIKEATGDAPPIKKAAGGLAYMLGE